mmetsp:Transcript_6903/g.10105  ORF Transcript_6903/g.10105 Transcript_6903/m.10105 type:complete len:81 (-) Transcript_6903:28-270(-)
MFGLSIWQLVQAFVLLVNAFAILHEKNVLKKIGLHYSPKSLENGGIKARIIHLLHAVRTLLRVPLIFVNIVVIVFSIILG